MKSLDLTKPVTTESLLSEFESRFNMTMDLTKFNEEELQDYANHVRTKIHEITQNTHFGQELKDSNYQKNQMMLDIVNQAINEYSDMEKKAASDAISAKDKLDNNQPLSNQEKETVKKLMTKEGVEEQSELILAAKDMMDKVTGYLEDLASMKTEGMLELADRIRDEMGADKADAFIQKIQPAIEQAEATLSTTRTELDNGVRILTGEETVAEPMGADDSMDSMNMDTDLDSLDAEGDEESDEFGAADAEAGGTEPEGREQRESKEVFEASNRILGKLAGK